MHFEVRKGLQEFVGEQREQGHPEGYTRACFREKRYATFSDLPEDIYSVIIDFVSALDEEDAEQKAQICDNPNAPVDYGVRRKFFYAHPGLLVLSLVGCRELVPLCRRHLFRVVEVWKASPNDDCYFDKSLQPRRLDDLLETSPSIAYYIRDVLWLLDKNSEDNPSACLYRLPRLRSMTLRGRIHDATDMANMPNTVAVLQHLSKLTSLEALHFSNIQNACILPLMTRCPSLKTLRLERVTLLGHTHLWTVFWEQALVSNTSSVDSLSISRPIDAPLCLKRFEDILIAAPKLRSAHLYWIHYAGKNEGFYFPTLAAWDAPAHNRQVELELIALMGHCGKTLHHLKLEMFYHPRNMVFNDLGRILSQFASTSIIETLDISLPYPGHEGNGPLPRVPGSSWTTLDNALSSYPFLRRLSITITLYTWSEYTVYPEGLIRQCWKRYEEGLQQLRSSSRITFSFTINMDCDGTERLRRQQLNITKVTGPLIQSSRNTIGNR